MKIVVKKHEPKNEILIKDLDPMVHTLLCTSGSGVCILTPSIYDHNPDEKTLYHWRVLRDIGFSGNYYSLKEGGDTYHTCIEHMMSKEFIVAAFDRKDFHGIANFIKDNS